MPEGTFHLGHWPFVEGMVSHYLLQVKGCLRPETLSNPQIHARQRVGPIGAPSMELYSREDRIHPSTLSTDSCSETRSMMTLRYIARTYLTNVRNWSYTVIPFILLPVQAADELTVVESEDTCT